MQSLQHIRSKVGTFLLHRELQGMNKKRSYSSLPDANEIGILYDCTYIDKEAVVHQYVQKLRNMGKKVFLMGFVDMPVLPGNKKFSLQSDFCWHEKLNLFLLPDKTKFASFLQTEFDLLLTLCESPSLPLKALSGNSAARYRVGPHIPEGHRYYDAMLDCGRNHTLNQLIHEIDFYLKAIT